jgi:hypothetical protein
MKRAESLKPTPSSTEPESDTGNTRVLLRIASLSTAFGLGCAVASLQALRWNASGLSFHFSSGTLAAFALGAAVALIYWRAAANSPLAARRGSVGLAIIGVGLFLYPLRFVSAGKLPEIMAGLGVAIVALSIVGFMLWRVGRFLESDARQAGGTSRASSDPPDSAK